MTNAKAMTFLVGVVLSASIGCAQATEPEEDAATSNGAESEVVAKVLGNSATVLSDRLIFPRSVFPQTLRTRIDTYNKALRVGKSKQEVENVLLVSDRQKDAIDSKGGIKEGIGNPYGYIRRALSYADEGPNTVVMTEQASLEEVFQELDANGMVEVGADARASQAGQVAPQWSKQFSKTIPVINLDNKDLFEKFGAKVRIKQGRVTLNTKVDVGVEISWFQLKEAHVIVDADADAVFELEVLNGLTVDFEKELFQGRWPVGSIGPIPVTAGVTASVKCRLSANGLASATAGARATAAMKAGVKYEKDRGVDGIWEQPSFKPEFIKPTLNLDAAASARAQCRLEPQIEVLLFDAAGPTVTPAIIATLDASGPPVTLALKGGLEVNVGGTLKIFGKELGEFNKTVFETERELWRGTL